MWYIVKTIHKRPHYLRLFEPRPKPFHGHKIKWTEDKYYAKMFTTEEAAKKELRYLKNIYPVQRDAKIVSF